MGNLRNVAVVLAGGTGTRVGLNIPKQLIKIAGKPIIEHTIATMQASPLIDEIIVMMAPGYLDDVRAIVKKGGYDKVTQILEGAGGPDATRNDTTALALAALGEEDCNVLLHDAVRPLVSQTIITANVEALETYEAVDTAIPSADTVIQVDAVAGEGGEPRMTDVLPRHLLRRGQTPQSFRLSTIRAAYAKAAEDPDFMATDDCTVVLRYLPDVPIAVVPGHERNMKVTEPIDVYIADKLFQLTSADHPAPLSEQEYHARLDGKTFVVFGGSYGIGGDIADLATTYGATVKSLLPVVHQHPRPAPSGHRRRLSRGAGRNRPDRLRRQHRRGAAPGRAVRVDRGDHLRGDRGELPRTDLHRPGVLSAPGRDARAHCCCSPRRPTRVDARVTRSIPRPRLRWSTSPRHWPTSGPAPGYG